MINTIIYVHICKNMIVVLRLCVSLISPQVLFLVHITQGHTVAIWTFTFHKISGFERVILKVNFNPIYRQKLSILLSENAGLFYPFFFYFLQNLSNPVLFTHCCCYFKELTCLNCDLMQKS